MALQTSSFRNTRQRPNWLQFFCCSALLQMATQAPMSFRGESDTLAMFTMRSVELGPEVASRAASMLA